MVGELSNLLAFDGVGEGSAPSGCAATGASDELPPLFFSSRGELVEEVVIISLLGEVFASGCDSLVRAPVRLFAWFFWSFLRTVNEPWFELSV